MPDMRIERRLSEALQTHPQVTKAVDTRLRALLAGQFVMRLMTDAELAKTAETLASEMAPPKADQEASQ